MLSNVSKHNSIAPNCVKRAAGYSPVSSAVSSGAEKQMPMRRPVGKNEEIINIMIVTGV